MADDDRGHLQRLEEAVAAALGRTPEHTDDADREAGDGPAWPTDLRLGRTAGMVAPPVARPDPPVDEDHG